MRFVSFRIQVGWWTSSPNQKLWISLELIRIDKIILKFSFPMRGFTKLQQARLCSTAKSGFCSTAKSDLLQFSRCPRCACFLARRLALRHISWFQERNRSPCHSGFSCPVINKSANQRVLLWYLNVVLIWLGFLAPISPSRSFDSSALVGIAAAFVRYQTSRSNSLFSSKFWNPSTRTPVARTKERNPPATRLQQFHF